MSDFITYQVVLSTLVTDAGSSVVYCSDSTNKASCKFVVNFDKIFNNYLENKIKGVKVRTYLTSKGNPSMTWDDNCGTLRCNLPTVIGNGNNTGNLILGAIFAQDLGITITGTPHKLICDTTSTQGVNIIMPKGIQTVNLQILNMSEAIQTNLADYQCILYFDVYPTNNEFQLN